MTCLCCCCKHTFFGAFIRELFSIGKSAGSLIKEALSLIILFQRISATKSFSAKFSKECLDMFKWAANLMEYFAKWVRTTPLGEYELFTLYVFIFPLTIMIFISSSISSKHLLFGIFLCGSLIMLGSAFAYLSFDKMMAAYLGVPASAVIVILLIIKLCSCCIKKCQHKKIRIKGNKKLKLTFSVLSASLIFFLLMIPIMDERGHLSNVICIIVLVLVIACFAFEIFVDFWLKDLILQVGKKFLSFLIECFATLIIPSTESFISIIQGNYHGYWQCIISYIVISLLIPIALTLAMIIYQHPDIEDKYKAPDSCFNIIAPYFELIDIVKQVIYAIISAYDFIWGCVVIEVIWVILVIVFRPYNNVSDYSLTFGCSLIVLIANCAVLYSNYHNSPVFSFKVTIILVILAIIPAIVSLYLFFIFDFNSDDYDESSSLEDSEINESTFKLGMIANFMTPVAFFCYATNITIITNKINIPIE